MSTEQRLRAYYRRYNTYWYRSGEHNIYEVMARVFKMPIKDIKDILGVKRQPPWPSVLPPGCAQESKGDCEGVVCWVRAWKEEQYWEARCRTHRAWWNR